MNEIEFLRFTPLKDAGNAIYITTKDDRWYVSEVDIDGKDVYKCTVPTLGDALVCTGEWMKQTPEVSWEK